MTILQTRYGKFSVPEHKDLIFDALREYGEWAQEELDLLSNFLCPGDVVLDIGAFIGTHARAFSQIVGSQGFVHAFEPNEHIYSELTKNAQLAPHANIKTYHFALGRIVQSRYLLQNDFQSNLGASRISEDCCSAETVTVAVKPLDDLHFNRIDLIKADVEGMEYDVLAGGEKTIHKHRPTLFLEANSLQASGKIVDWALGMNYMIFGNVSRAYNVENFNRSKNNMFGEGRECGLLLIHRDRLSHWADTLSALELPAIETIDDIALLLLQKPQYVHEVLRGDDVCRQIAGLSQSSEELQSKITVIENAKSRAEDLTYSHLAEVVRLQSQLAATEAAKDYAETLALSCCDQLDELTKQLRRAEMTLNKIKNSKIYKLLAVLRLAPKGGV